MIKILIKKLLNMGVDPYAIFYFRCDELVDFKELLRVLRTYLNFKKTI